MTDQNVPVQWWSSPKAVLRHILTLDDTAHSVALGTAIGMFIGMTPTVGIQMALVFLVSFLVSPLFRFNRVAALVTVYISNPLTVLPIYWFNYQVGLSFVSGSATWETFSQSLGPQSELSWWQQIRWLSLEVGMPLIVGSLVVAVVCALISYPTVIWLRKSIASHAPKRLKPPTVKPEKEPVTSAVERATTKSRTA